MRGITDVLPNVVPVELSACLSVVEGDSQVFCGYSGVSQNALIKQGFRV